MGNKSIVIITPSKKEQIDITHFLNEHNINPENGIDVICREKGSSLLENGTLLVYHNNYPIHDIYLSASKKSYKIASLLLRFYSEYDNGRDN